MGRRRSEAAEIERRLVTIDAGTVELISWEDVRLKWLPATLNGENDGIRI